MTTRGLCFAILAWVLGCSGSDARPGVLPPDPRPLLPADASAPPDREVPVPDAAPQTARPPEPVVPLEVPVGTAGPCGPCARLCAPQDLCLADRCVPRADGVPRLLAPPSLGRVTTQRPTFRWVPPAGASGAQVQLCRDRPCRDLVARYDTTEASLALPEALPPGVYFWRVAPRRRGVLEEKFSATWEFVARSRDSAVASAFGRIHDVNGDGYADFVLQHGALAGVYHGGPGGLSRAPARVLRGGPEGASVRLGAVGDLDGDGFCDVLAVALEGTDPARRAVTWFRGSAAGLHEAASLSSEGPWPEGLSGVGDLDGDGYGDLLGVDPARGAVPARRRVYPGAPGGVLPGAVPFPLAAGPWRGHSALGDADGDGRPDLLLGAPEADDGAGRAALWHNRGGCFEGALSPLAGVSVPEGRLGDALHLAGDFNGDGLADPVAAMPFAPHHDGRGRVLVFRGAEPLTHTRVLPFAGPQLEGLRLGAADLDGDGHTDLVAWLHNELRGPALHVFHGGPAGLAPTPTLVVYPQGFGAVETALAFAVAGDTDRDGHDDLVVYLGPGEVLLARGGPRGLVVAPGPLLTLP